MAKIFAGIVDVTEKEQELGDQIISAMICKRQPAVVDQILRDTKLSIFVQRILLNVSADCP